MVSETTGRHGSVLVSHRAKIKLQIYTKKILSKVNSLNFFVHLKTRIKFVTGYEDMLLTTRRANPTIF